MRPTSELLPEPDIQVLAYEKGEGFFIGHYHVFEDGTKTWFIDVLLQNGFGSESWADPEDVTHWQPLPEKPE